jgi:hypothetical protein
VHLHTILVQAPVNAVELPPFLRLAFRNATLALARVVRIPLFELQLCVNPDSGLVGANVSDVLEQLQVCVESLRDLNTDNKKILFLFFAGSPQRVFKN